MKLAKDKHVVMGADFAGFPLKKIVKEFLIEVGWHVTDLTPDREGAPMYQRVGFMLGAQIAERKFEKALAFCGSGMGIHIAASKCPHVHSAVAESVLGARRAATANNANVLAMGAFWTGPALGKAMAFEFLEHGFCDGYEAWDGFREYHQVGFNECENFDYDAYKANGFEVADPRVPALASPPHGLAF